jgi:hypothetical protein
LGYLRGLGDRDIRMAENAVNPDGWVTFRYLKRERS